MRVLATIDVDDDDDEDGCLPILARVRLCVAVAVLAIVICLISSASAFLAASFEPPGHCICCRLFLVRSPTHTSHEPRAVPHRRTLRTKEALRCRYGQRRKMRVLSVLRRRTEQRRRMWWWWWWWKKSLWQVRRERLAWGGG